MGKLVEASCPGLEDDYYNKQKLVQPRFSRNKYDQEQDFYDLNIKNLHRLNALDDDRFKVQNMRRHQSMGYFNT